MFNKDNEKLNRTITIPVINNATADISLSPQENGELRNTEKGDSYFIVPEPLYSSTEEDSVYNFPFLLNEDNSPWQEANNYLFQKALSFEYLGKNLESIRRVASQLLDYKMFCDSNGIDYLDCKRPGKYA